MRPRLPGATLALVVVAGLALAKNQKSEEGARKPASPRVSSGKIKVIDAKKGLLVLTVKDKGGTRDMELKMDRATRFAVLGDTGSLQFLTVEQAARSHAFQVGKAIQVYQKGNRVEGLVSGAVPSLGGLPRFTAGKIKKVDAGKGLLTVTVVRSDKPKDVDLKIDDRTRFLAFSPKGDATELAGKEGLKAEQFKPGTAIRFIADAEGNATLVTTTPFFKSAEQPFQPRGGPSSSGTIKKRDAKKGTLTLAVKGKEGTKEVELKILDDTKFMAFTSQEGQKEFTGAEGLKAESFKEGTDVRYFADAEGNARMIAAIPLFNKPAQPKRPDQVRFVTGTIKKIDARKGTLTLTVKEKEAMKDLDFKLGAATRFIVFGGKGRPKRLTAEAAARAEPFKEGTPVRASVDPKGNVKMVAVVPLFKKPSKEEK